MIQGKLQRKSSQKLKKKSPSHGSSCGREQSGSLCGITFMSVYNVKWWFQTKCARIASILWWWVSPPWRSRQSATCCSHRELTEYKVFMKRGGSGRLCFSSSCPLCFRKRRLDTFLFNAKVFCLGKESVRRQGVVVFRFKKIHWVKCLPISFFFFLMKENWSHTSCWYVKNMRSSHGPTLPSCLQQEEKAVGDNHLCGFGRREK